MSLGKIPNQASSVNHKEESHRHDWSPLKIARRVGGYIPIVGIFTGVARIRYYWNEKTSHEESATKRNIHKIRGIGEMTTCFGVGYIPLIIADFALKFKSYGNKDKEHPVEIEELPDAKERITNDSKSILTNEAETELELVNSDINQEQFDIERDPLTFREPRPEFIRNNYVEDPLCYPFILNEEQLKENEKDYFNATTLGNIRGNQVLLDDEITISSQALPKESPVTGEVELRYWTAGIISTRVPEMWNKFERTDGVNWRDFPGDMFIGVYFKCKKNEDVPPLEVLPTQLFLGKKKGDTVEFKWDGKIVNFEIKQSNVELERYLTLAREKAYHDYEGKSFYIAPRYEDPSFQYLNPVQLQKKLYREDLSKKAEQRDESVFDEASKLSDMVLLDLSETTIPKFMLENSTYHIDIPGVKNVQIFYLKNHILILGKRENDDSEIVVSNLEEAKHFRFVLDLTEIAPESGCSEKMLADQKHEAGVFSFSLQIK